MKTINLKLSINNYLLFFLLLTLWIGDTVTAHSDNIQSTDQDIKTITAIYPQGDWDLWLLGYRIILSDGTMWFSERGPIDFWDWEVGDTVRIEVSDDPLNRRLLQWGKPFFGEAPYRIFNIDRGDWDDFQALTD